VLHKGVKMDSWPSKLLEALSFSSLSGATSALAAKTFAMLLRKSPLSLVEGSSSLPL
jgi:hypothetical protein